MTVNSIPIYIEIDTVSCFDSLCRPLKRAPIFLCCNRGVTHAPLKRGGSTPSLRLYRPPGSKFRSANTSQTARQSRVCRYCLMMPMRYLCPLIMLVGSGAYVYHQIGNSPRKSAANEGVTHWPHCVSVLWNHRFCSQEKGSNSATALGSAQDLRRKE